MDEILLDCLHDGLDQLVILGAGMDRRAYRFADVLARVAIFELDHPVSAERKRRRYDGSSANCRPASTYVEADLDMHRIADVLRRHGFQEHLRTLFIWSGVSGYLTTDAVDAVLQDVASLRKASIVFDYWHAAVARGELDAYGARQAATRAANLGEPYRSGIEPDHLAQHLAARGLHLIDDIGPWELRERYLTCSDGRTRATIRIPEHRPRCLLTDDIAA
jgi:methyltransferase (TIGR00027 family)